MICIGSFGQTPKIYTQEVNFSKQLRIVVNAYLNKDQLLKDLKQNEKEWLKQHKVDAKGVHSISKSSYYMNAYNVFWNYKSYDAALAKMKVLIAAIKTDLSDLLEVKKEEDTEVTFSLKNNPQALFFITLEINPDNNLFLTVFN